MNILSTCRVSTKTQYSKLAVNSVDLMNIASKNYVCTNTSNCNDDTL